jgi:hypothetical protein
MTYGKLGRWAFIIGLVVAILLGFVTFSYSSLVLVLLGLVVGFLNVTEKEATNYLVAVIALIVVGIAGLQAFSLWGTFYTWIQAVFSSFVTFASASAVVVAIKVMFENAKEN